MVHSFTLLYGVVSFQICITLLCVVLFCVVHSYSFVECHSVVYTLMTLLCGDLPCGV